MNDSLGIKNPLIMIWKLDEVIHFTSNGHIIFLANYTKLIKNLSKRYKNNIVEYSSKSTIRYHLTGAVY